MGTDKGVRLAKYSETLDLNPHGRKKLRCPECGSLSFTPYIFEDSGEAVDLNECGYCDHQESCSYHVTPKQYFERHPERNPRAKLTPEEKEERKRKEAQRLADLQHEKRLMDQARMLREIGIESESQEQTHSMPEKGAKSLSKQLTRHGWDIVSKTEGRALETPFYRFLLNHFDTSTIEAVFKLYHMGADKFGRVIYWQIDQDNEVRAGKIMQYGENGHRAKNPDGSPVAGATNWVHSVLKRHGKLPEGWQLEQCLFGSHLLTLDDLPPEGICLVEAEKSAIIGACAFPEYTWIATGGKYNLKAENLKPLTEYTHQTGLPVIVFADLGSTQDWEARLEPFKDILPFTLSDFLERNATPKARAKGMDLADLICGEF